MYSVADLPYVKVTHARTKTSTAAFQVRARSVRLRNLAKKPAYGEFAAPVFGSMVRNRFAKKRKPRRKLNPLILRKLQGGGE